MSQYSTSNASLMLLELDPMSPGSEIMEDVEEIIQIMSEELTSGKSVPNCTFINILLCVSDPDILQRFVDIGGWGSLNDWLSKAKDTEDDDLLMELLKVYAQMPVTVDLLKQNSCAKTIKQLSKSDRPVVKKEAGAIVDLWMQKVKGKPEDKSSKKSKLKNGERHRRKKSSVDGSDNDSISSYTDDAKRSKTVSSSKSRSSEQENSESKKKSVKRSSQSKQSAAQSSPPGKKLKSDSTVDSKIKVPPPSPKLKPQIHEIYESSGFMDALTPSSLPTLKIRKRKVSIEKPGCTTPPKQQRTDSDSMSPQEEKLVKLDDEKENEQKKDEPVSPEEKKPLLPSFYKDTLETPEETEPKKEDEVVKAEEPVKVKKKKKNVTWVEEANLKTFFYFPKDENERVNVNRLKDFDETKRNEMIMEKKMNAQARSHDVPDSTWRKPRLLSLPPGNPLPPRGCNSTEKETQKKREEGVLFALYFTKNMIPESGKEPEPESVSPCEPKVIPLEDETGNSSQVVYHQDYPQPVREQQKQQHHTPPPSSSQFSLPPDVASLLANLAQQGIQGQPTQPHMGHNGMDMPPMQVQQQQQPYGGPLDTSDPNIQHLIQAIMAGQPIEGVPEELMAQLKQMLGLPAGSHGTEYMPPQFNNMGPNEWRGGPGPMNGNGPPPPNNGPPNNMMGPGPALLGQGPPGYGGPMGGGGGGPPMGRDGGGPMGREGGGPMGRDGGGPMGRDGGGPMGRDGGGPMGREGGGPMGRDGGGPMGRDGGGPMGRDGGGPMGRDGGGPMGRDGGGPMGRDGGGPPYRGGGGPGRGPPNMMGGGRPPRGPMMRGRGGGGGPRFNQNAPVCRHFMNGQCRFGNSCRKLHPGFNCPPMHGMMGGSPSHPGMSPPRSGSPS